LDAVRLNGELTFHDGAATPSVVNRVSFECDARERTVDARLSVSALHIPSTALRAGQLRTMIHATWRPITGGVLATLTADEVHADAQWLHFANDENHVAIAPLVVDGRLSLTCRLMQ